MIDLPDADTWEEQFHGEGYVILRRFLNPTISVRVQGAVEEVVEEHVLELLSDGTISNPCREEPFTVRLMKVLAQCPGIGPKTYRVDLHKAGMFSLFFHPPLLDLVEKLIGPEIRIYPNYSVRPKLPDDKATLVLWHQDAGYTAVFQEESGANMPEAADVNILRMVNVWSPLVPARVKNGCMQFIPRSHKFGLVPHSSKNEFYLEIESDYLQPHLAEAVDIEVDPGDVVLFSNLLYHRGLPNNSAGIRWSCDWRYQDANQSTARKEHGHIARSRNHPDSAVKNAEEWASLSFG